jgi:hypothetical protein
MRIVILMHECQRRRRPPYLIDALAEAWECQGLSVTWVYGVHDHRGADLLIPHVDLTRTPPEYAEYVQSFSNAINRGAADLSKRMISQHLLGRDDDYRGPVIVKTDNNATGHPEYQVSRSQHPWLARLRRRATPLAEFILSRPLAWRTLLQDYPVYERLAAVPSAAFTNPALVVERFLPEREGNRYFLRHYLFLGDHVRSVRVSGSQPILKRAACVPVEEGLAVPAAVLAMRRRLGLDYGKIDYTIHDGEVAVLDVNRTPMGPGTPAATARTVADLADGIWSLLPTS